MLSKKALLFNDLYHYTLVIHETNMEKLKEIEKDIISHDYALWYKYKEEIVKNACYAKFSQNKQLKDLLLSTDHKIIAKASDQDPFYGIGYTTSHPLCIKQDKWKGKNKLGKIIMEVREELKK